VVLWEFYALPCDVQVRIWCLSRLSSLTLRSVEWYLNSSITSLSDMMGFVDADTCISRDLVGLALSSYFTAWSLVYLPNIIIVGNKMFPGWFLTCKPNCQSRVNASTEVAIWVVIVSVVVSVSSPTSCIYSLFSSIDQSTHEFFFPDICARTSDRHKQTHGWQKTGTARYPRLQER
jgi:hypothetical protein